MMEFFWFKWFVLGNALLLTLLGLNVSRLRIKLKVAHGDGGQIPLKQAIRAHGNGVEHVLLFGMILLAVEMTQAQGTILAVLVSGFTVARVLHAIGMLSRHILARRIGASLTFAGELAALAVLFFSIQSS